MTILVIGKNGQLGKCMLDAVRNRITLNEYVFLGRDDIDITNKDMVDAVIDEYNPNVVVNCAAYTNVEKAEDCERELAYDVNVMGVDYLANAAYNNDAAFIHISTDYVFDGENRDNVAYWEIDDANPINVYGASKLEGEISALSYPNSIVIRTSWLYSIYGKNFMTTILNRVKDGKISNVVSDQYGTPTSARYLANALVHIIEHKKYIGKSGLYHLTNSNYCSWYDFAKAIECFYNIKTYGCHNSMEKDVFNANGFRCCSMILPCSSDEYPTKAKRPKFSVLNCNKFSMDFDYKLKHWCIPLLDEIMLVP